MNAPAFDAVVLAGGSGDRLGGVDKATVPFRGTTLLERSLTAVTEARLVVCVGPERATGIPVSWIREEPPGGGPVAALAAALPLLEASPVAVLACDLPFIDGSVVRDLLAACRGDGALLVDGEGRAQYLAAAYRLAFLRERLSGSDGAGRSMRSLLRGASLTEVPGGVAATDVDTPEDLARLSRL